MIIFSLFICFLVSLHDGLSTGHGVQSTRETDTSMDYSKESKRGHADRGEVSSAVEQTRV